MSDNKNIRNDTVERVIVQICRNFDKAIDKLIDDAELITQVAGHGNLRNASRGQMSGEVAVTAAFRDLMYAVGGLREKRSEALEDIHQIRTVLDRTYADEEDES